MSENLANKISIVLKNLTDLEFNKDFRKFIAAEIIDSYDAFERVVPPEEATGAPRTASRGRDSAAS